MSSLEKKKKRLLDKPSDYTEKELMSLLRSLGFKETKRKNGKVKYENDKKEKVLYHPPHDTNIFKDYKINEFIRKLKEFKLL